MYNVKRYTVSKARESFASVLDEAEANGSVLIERGGIQYVITARRAPARARRKRSVLETIDPAVAAGQWTWEMTAGGLRFTTRRRS
jgi:hypothetical protein